MNELDPSDEVDEIKCDRELKGVRENLHSWEAGGGGGVRGGVAGQRTFQEKE